MLVATDLTKQYGDTPSVEGVSFGIGQADVVGLLGANGAGKSTLMNMLTGCMAPTSGSITVGGCSMRTAARDAKRQIGYLPEVPPLYADMTVREQLRFAADLRSVGRAHWPAEVDRVCELTQIGDVRHRPIRQLSKGYRQRVGLAQALVASPPLLVLDEPTAGLDPKQIMEFRNLMLSLSRQHTIVISSHILSEITSLCTRLLVLRRGRLVANNTPSELTGPRDGGQALELRVGGSQEHIRAVLAAVSGIASVALRASSEPGLWDVAVTSDAGCDLRAALSAALAQAGCPLVLMKPVGETLEEVFMRLAA